MSVSRNLLARALKPVLLGLFFAAVGGGPAPVGAVTTEGVFQIDGNAIHDAAPGIDWADFWSSPGAGQIFVTDPVNSGTDNNFTGGGSKDERDISSAGITNTFWQNTATSPPDKDDLEHAFADLITVNGNEIAYFGADRFSNNGDSAIGFWFFRQNVKANPDGTFSGKHTVGDILVTSDFLQGGGDSVINVFKWNGNASSPLTLLAHSEVKNGVPIGGTIDANGVFCVNGNIACAVSNKGDTPAPWPYTFKGSNTPNNFPHGTFFEGGVNLSQLLGGSECFSSFMAMTRTSASTTAQLKDFVIGPFKNCSIGVSKTCNLTRLTTADEYAATGKYFVASYSGAVTNTGDGLLPVGTVITVRDDAGTPDPNTSDDVTPAGFPYTTTATLAKGDPGIPFNGTFFTNDNPPHNTVYATATFSGNVLSAQYDVDCTGLALSADLGITKNCGSSDGTKPGTELVVNNGVLALQVNVSGMVCNNSTTPGLDLAVTVTDDANGISNPPDPTTLWSGTLTQGGPDSTRCHIYDYSYLPASGDGSTSPASAGAFSDQVTAIGSNPRLSPASQPVAQNHATCKVCPGG